MSSAQAEVTPTPSSSSTAFPTPLSSASPVTRGASLDGARDTRLCVTNASPDELTILTRVAPTADGVAPSRPVTTGTTTNYGADGVAEGEGPVRSGAMACFTSGSQPTVTVAFAGEEPITLESDNPFVGTPSLGLYSVETDDFVKVDLLPGTTRSEEFLHHSFDLGRLATDAGAFVEFAVTVRS
jgi:hypothetical protein